MQFSDRALDPMERLTFNLRSLYTRSGFMPYKMSKFEEYDLYAKNKDFLISGDVITFTDRNGKLMALKPDVTLSIVKSTEDIEDVTEKLYYNENVYRVQNGSDMFKEIMQTGLECIGSIDNVCVGEVLYLAAKSLSLIGRPFILSVSQMDMVMKLLKETTEDRDLQDKLIKCIGEKNPHGIRALLSDTDYNETALNALLELLTIDDTIEDALPKIDAIAAANGLASEASDFRTALSVFDGSSMCESIRVDFSEISDRNYYNGVVFKGYTEGAPGSVLSGGRYDKLMKKMNRKACAIGFAMYMDRLELLLEERSDFDADMMLLYTDTTDLRALRDYVKAENKNGQSILIGKKVNPKLRFRKIAVMKESEVTVLEENA